VVDVEKQVALKRIDRFIKLVFIPARVRIFIDVEQSIVLQLPAVFKIPQKFVIKTYPEGLHRYSALGHAGILRALIQYQERIGMYR